MQDNRNIIAECQLLQKFKPSLNYLLQTLQNEFFSSL